MAARASIPMMKWVTCAAAAILMGGCARFPAVVSPSSKLLLFNFRMDLAVRTGQEAGANGVPYVYMVVLRFSIDPAPTDGGPIPVVAPPWGNGFVAQRATHFVLWDPTQSNEYLIYQFNDPTQLTQWFPVGIPFQFTRVNQGDDTIQFQIDLSQLYPVAADRDALKSMQVNFMTMDRIPQSGNSKEWDALGESRNLSSINDYITVPLDRFDIYTNANRGNIEPTGDTAIPSLDIADWSVEVRQP